MFQSLWIVGCAQNCGSEVEGVFSNIESLRVLFQESSVLILENDSLDNTCDAIRSYGRQTFAVNALTFPGLNQRIHAKTVRLAHLRNAALAWLKQKGAWKSHGLVLILDLDEVNQEEWDLAAFQDVLSWFMAKPKAAAVFANQLGPYYDLWALRHPKLCPNDIWDEVFDAKLENPQLTDQQLFATVVKPRQLELSVDCPPVAVESAFGGLGFYKTSWLSKNPFPYVGDQTKLIMRSTGPHLLRRQVAEHVSFHAGLRSVGAKLWIHPALINWDTQSSLLAGMGLNPASWRHLEA